MAKTQRKFLHKRPKGANERNFMKKYYGSLFAIIVLIVATATKNAQILFVFHKMRGFVHFLNDLVGMAVIPL